MIFSFIKLAITMTDVVTCTISSPHRMPSSMEREAAIHMRLRHPSIVSMMGVVFDRKHQGFVLEYVQFGSFTEFMDKIKRKDGL